MAVVNRTPDSFFDRGVTREFGPALDAASRAVADGAEIVDIGGVKAGPGDEVSPRPPRSTGSRAWSPPCASVTRTW
jgi:dihydropteroate synthase